MKKLISLFCLFSAVTIGYTQPAFVQSVLLENDTITAPGYFTLKWNQEAGATQYRIFRKELGATSWNAGPLAILDPDVTSWTDSSVQKGEVYEYRVQKLASGYTGYGYMTAGVDLDPVESPGRVLVLVTPDIAMNLNKGEIDQMTTDLQREGWDVTAITTAATDEPEDIKDRITGWYQMDPATSRGVILLGHIPVAYSGNLAPDGHPDHQGAWPADGYYGDMDGNWSDWQVNNTVANQTRHHNIPADGKFDQSTFPSPLELWVGRIDFANLPAFSESEVELTRQYLDKLHRFKTAQFRAIPRGVLEDNFGNFQEGFSQNGWKNFSTIVGMDNVKAMDYRSTLQADSYMFSYGCGGGNYRGASGISNTTNMAADSLQTIFTMLFGSYFGDWDSNDNFLRAALASGTTLTNMWAGRPHWQIHPMALGYTIGDCALLSMNNNGVYVTGFAGRGVQMALLGDPTLQWHYVKPPEMLEATENNHRIQLEWVASEDEVEGYHIYRKRSSESGFHRLSDQLVKTTSFIDSCLLAGESYEYLVRAVDLIQSASGSYYRSSLGAMTQISPVNDLGLSIDFSMNTEYEKLMISDQSANVGTYRWTFGDGGSSSDPAPQYEYQKTDSLFDVEICLAAKNMCFEELSCRDLTVMGSLPRLENIETDPPKCAEDSTINWKATLVYSGAEPLVFSNQVMRNGLELLAELVNGKEIISVTNDLGDQLTYGPYQLTAPDPILGTYDIREPDDVLNSGMISISDISGGVPPYMVLWNTGSTESIITGLEPGIFWVDITDGNGCTIRDSFELKRSTSTIPQFIEGVRVFPNPFEDQLVFEDDLGRESVILLRDLTGRELYRWESIGATVMSLPVSDALSPGIYLVTVQIQGQEVTYKLTKAGRP
mgnify:CR=1 FL=1